MKVYNASGTLHVYFSEEQNELFELGANSEQLEANLQDRDSGEDLGKTVLVLFDQTQKERLKRDWYPEDAHWDDIQRIKLTINNSLYADIMNQQVITERLSVGDVLFESTNTGDLK